MGFSYLKFEFAEDGILRRTRIFRRRDPTKLIIITLLVPCMILIHRYVENSLGVGEAINFNEDNFEYPLIVSDLSQMVREYSCNKISFQENRINQRYSTVRFIHKSIKTTQDFEPHGMLIVVKSAIENYEKRQSIRKTWGDLEYLKETQLSPALPTKLVFISGRTSNHNVEAKNLYPNEPYNDIVIADFVDTYGNNTYKTILSLKWALEEFPSDFKYMLIVDDDMYVDLENAKEYLNSFAFRKFKTKYEKKPAMNKYYRKSTGHKQNVTLGSTILKNGLYMGQVYWNAEPLRPPIINIGTFKAPKSEWIIQYDDYKYKYFPSYIPGAAIILSKTAVEKMYYGSMFVRHFPVDDVYLGILAYKLGITPVHNGMFHAEYAPNGLQISEDTLGDVIALHGCECSAQMVDLWINRNPYRLLKCSKG